MDTVAAVMAAKREIALAGTEVAGLALEVGGGTTVHADGRGDGMRADTGIR